jgi:hypothetical protein
MKIDRVILSTNNNPTYYQFWNPLSKVYKENFGITPTLIFLGSEKELEGLPLSREFGDIIRQDIVPSKDVSWTTTWALFYFTKNFPNEVCLINGIDQIPMGSKFLIDYIKEINENKYVMLIDDAYKLMMGRKDWSEGGHSPSAYHIAKGETFNKVYSFEDTFEDEIKKIESIKLDSMWGTWGMDEAYSSQVLYNKKNEVEIECLSKFGEILNGGRIDCHRSLEVPFNLDTLKNNGYIECHSCRPYLNHKKYLDSIFDNVPKFV